MSIQPGSHIGQYDVLSLLGEGGMGAVFRGRDTTLKRDVALKVMTGVAATLEQHARFQREAEVLASLDHPNIGPIYGLLESEGDRVLVLALVEGPTLADLLSNGPLTESEALKIARQVIEALEYAHERGVIHRDLKPANIKITPEGVVKVLDFGLAKVLEDDPPARSSANSPTLTMGHTHAGMILGTAAYMSPEQAVGRPVDRRTDIFSFGAVLYEMLTGKQAFAGGSIPDILEAVVKQEPDSSGLEKLSPPSRLLLNRCLEKDRKLRLQAIGEARILLDRPLAVLDQPLADPPPRKFGWAPWAVAAVAALGFAGLAWVHFRAQPPIANLVKFTIPAPEGTTLGNSIALSPDGHWLAFFARTTSDSNSIEVFLRSLDSLESKPVPGTEGAFGAPSWSPDSTRFVFTAGRTLKKVDIVSRSVQKIAELPAAYRGVTWAPDGTLVLGTARTGLLKLSETGGPLVPLTSLAKGEQHHESPEMLPDGIHFLYRRVGGDRDGDSLGVYLGSLDRGPDQQDSKPLWEGTEGTIHFAKGPGDSGFVIYTKDGTLLAQAIRSDGSKAEPAAIPIAETGSLSGAPTFSVSMTGVLAYRNGAGTSVNQLTWVDRTGKPVGRFGSPTTYGGVALSPDGTHAALQSEAHLFFADLARGVSTRVNPGDPSDGSAALSPDGRIAFSYAVAGARGDLYVRQASGAGIPELLAKSSNLLHPNHWSLDGRYLICDEHTLDRNQDLFIVPMTGADHKPIPFLATSADETFGQFSPDSRWVAYSSDESGKREVYVQGFLPDKNPAAGVGKWQISADGGDKPRWRRDGKELYYLARNGKMMAVPIKSTASTFEPGMPTALFDTQLTGFFPYDVAPDGRFLLNSTVEDSKATIAPITIVLNWMAPLGRR